MVWSTKLLEYVIVKTELMQVIQETGIGVAGGVVDEFREQSASVDNLLESRLKSLFKKRTPSTADSAPRQIAEGE